MPICDVMQPPSTESTRQPTDLAVRLVRLALLVLISPALLLVLAVGGTLLLAQKLTNGWTKPHVASPPPIGVATLGSEPERARAAEPAGASQAR
jgi:hypothetical protein